MTERKPPHASWESWVERQIRQAAEKGEFENLPGSGKPLPDAGQAYDPDWWVKRTLKKEGLSVLPDTLQLRLDVEKELEKIEQLDDEGQMRKRLELLNEKIRKGNATASSGPPSNLSPIDIDEYLRRHPR